MSTKQGNASGSGEGPPGRGTRQAQTSGASAAVRLAVASAVGVVVGVVASLPGTWQQGLLAGFIASAAVYLIWVWRVIWPMDPRHTAAEALREDPGNKLADTVIVVSALASLVAAGLLLAGTSSSDSGGAFGQAGITVLSVFSAWGMVHTNFTLRYARLYYTGKDGGVDFNEDDPPQYTDFAYLALTIGMTFQVSDTDLQTKTIRATGLRQALLSYLFGVIIIAAVINLIAGLSK